ncbi:winged helix-turn-helix domain-containing protein [Vagococcus sp.]|uniref:winged helix-turn-helix domain-containing protein n=1 Tax=Vagococcus sp. TaxID=1933889 RepID=UPI002FC5DEE7
MKTEKINNQLVVISQDVLNKQSEKFVTSFDSSFLTIQLMSTIIFDDENELNKLKKVKGIILVVDTDKETTIETCSLILKIRDITKAPIWLYSKPYLAIEREVFLNIGIDGFFSDDQSMREIELIILNLLKRAKERDVEINKTKNILDLPEMTSKNKRNNYQNRKNNNVYNEKLEEKRKVEIVLDSELENIWVNDLEVLLSSKQFVLAELLISNKNKVVDYATIYVTIWGGEYDKDKRNMVGAIVAQLRSKFERNKISTKFIYNVPNTGYKFVL